MAEVKVLVEGNHEKNSDGGLNIWCTTTLIKSDKNVIVDPGAFVNREELVKALKNEKLNPEDIEIIILTHLHLDHATNISLFKNANIFLRFRGETNYPGQFQNIREGKAKRFDILNEPIVEGVKIIETPGHTSDSIAMIVQTKEGAVAIAGDAITSEEWADLNKKADPNLAYDADKFDISRKKILEIADWIIPGHGKMFKNNKK